MFHPDRSNGTSNHDPPFSQTPDPSIGNGTGVERVHTNYRGLQVYGYGYSGRKFNPRLHYTRTVGRTAMLRVGWSNTDSMTFVRRHLDTFFDTIRPTADAWIVVLWHMMVLQRTLQVLCFFTNVFDKKALLKPIVEVHTYEFAGTPSRSFCKYGRHGS